MPNAPGTLAEIIFGVALVAPFVLLILGVLFALVVRGDRGGHAHKAGH